MVTTTYQERIIVLGLIANDDAGTLPLIDLFGVVRCANVS
jgi:hypothetical protein